MISVVIMSTYLRIMAFVRGQRNRISVRQTKHRVTEGKEKRSETVGGASITENR